MAEFNKRLIPSNHDIIDMDDDTKRSFGITGNYADDFHMEVNLNNDTKDVVYIPVSSPSLTIKGKEPNDVILHSDPDISSIFLSKDFKGTALEGASAIYLETMSRAARVERGNTEPKGTPIPSDKDTTFADMFEEIEENLAAKNSIRSLTSATEHADQIRKSATDLYRGKVIDHFKTLGITFEDVELSETGKDQNLLPLSPVSISRSCVITDNNVYCALHR